MNAKTRPVHLDLTKIRLPVAGFMSIIHRATGVLMVLAIPLVIYLLQSSLASPEGFAWTASLLGGALGKLILFLAFWALLHHLFAGIRYLLIDMDLGVERPMFRNSAWAVLVAAPVAALLMVGVMS